MRWAYSTTFLSPHSVNKESKELETPAYHGAEMRHRLLIVVKLQPADDPRPSAPRLPADCWVWRTPAAQTHEETASTCRRSSADCSWDLSPTANHSTASTDQSEHVASNPTNHSTASTDQSEHVASNPTNHKACLDNKLLSSDRCSNTFIS